jgi:hypothetical protein
MEQNNNANELIKDLEENIYCRLRPSNVSGVGIFAIRDIPKGINPLKNFLKCRYVEVDPKLVFENEKIDPAVKELVNDLYVIADGKLNLWEGGMNALDIGFFINSSDNPNMIAEPNGESFISARDIKKGEELFVDYGTYAENKEV